MDHAVTFEVPAAPADVWAVLEDVEQWPRWTASMTSVTRQDEGALRIGSTARIKQPGFAAARWTVTELVPGRSFTWESRVPGVHSIGEHVVEPDGASSRVTLRIVQRGALAGVRALLFGTRSRRYVQMEADGLRAELVARASIVEDAPSTRTTDSTSHGSDSSVMAKGAGPSS